MLLLLYIYLNKRCKKEIIMKQEILDNRNNPTSMENTEEASNAVFFQTDTICIRNVQASEGKMVSEIEHACFSSNVADNEDVMIQRAICAGDEMLVVVDKNTKDIIAYMNAIVTNEEHMRDAFFEDNTLHNPQGENVMILGIGVLSKYRNCGIAKELLNQFINLEKQRGRKKIFLTCHIELVAMYERFGFSFVGKSQSILGGEEWFEMVLDLQ